MLAMGQLEFDVAIKKKSKTRVQYQGTYGIGEDRRREKKNS